MPNRQYLSYRGKMSKFLPPFLPIIWVGVADLGWYIWNEICIVSQFRIHTVHELFSSYRSYELEVKVVWTHEYESAKRMNFMNLELRRPWTHEYELRKSWTVWIRKSKKLISSYELYELCELQTEVQSLEQNSQCRGAGVWSLFKTDNFLLM